MSLLCIYFPNPFPSVSSLLTVGRQTISTSQSNLKYKYKYKYGCEYKSNLKYKYKYGCEYIFPETSSGSSFSW